MIEVWHDHESVIFGAAGCAGCGISRLPLRGSARKEGFQGVSSQHEIIERLFSLDLKVTMYERYPDIRGIPSVGRSINLSVTSRGLRAVSSPRYTFP